MSVYITGLNPDFKHAWSKAAALAYKRGIYHCQMCSSKAVKLSKIQDYSNDKLFLTCQNGSLP